MDDLTPFERQLADGLRGLMGPPEPVDGAAILAAVTATQSSKRRVRSMFSAGRLVLVGAIVALAGGLLLTRVSLSPGDGTPVPGAVSASPTATQVPLASMITEEVGPGAVRIVSDGAGHDLGDTRPTGPSVPNDIAVASDGTVWLISAAYGSDPENPDDERSLWALGRPGMTKGVPFGDLAALEDGSLLVVGESVMRFDGEALRPDVGPRQRALGDGFTLWLLEPDDLMGLVDDPGSIESPGTRLAMVSKRDSWRSLSDFYRGSDGDLGRCSGGRDGIVCVNEFYRQERRFLEGTDIGKVVVSPFDRTIWAVGDLAGDCCALYRITPMPE